jgi:predicted ArsR family transcriptional regulator
MQQTRRYIIEILRELGQATVDDIVRELQKRRGKITAVTVRHHLGVLQTDGLIISPELRRRSTPGRPQHIYSLTDKATDLFPNNYQQLAASLLDQLSHQLPPDGVNVILEGVATQMANQAHISATHVTERLDMVVDYLNEQGYDACWEGTDEGYILHTANCPYHHINHVHDDDESALCQMDIRLMTSLLGAVPRRVARMTEGDSTCSYLIPLESS